MSSLSNSSLLLVLPVPLLLRSDGLYFEQQACNGLHNWLCNFSDVVVACPLMPSIIADKDTVIQWKKVDQIEGFDRLSFVTLPWAYSPLSFAKNYFKTKKILSDLIINSRYLSFAIGGLFGDWAAIAALEAVKLKRKFSVWTDRVEDEVIRRGLPGKSIIKQMYWRVQIPFMRSYHHHLVRSSSLGLFHGRDCYDAYASYSSNPHLAHDIHLKKNDQINAGELCNKISLLSSELALKICYAGRMEDMKGPLEWIEVVNRLKQLHVPVEATWFGDGPLIEDFKDSIRKKGLTDVISIPGFCSDREILMNNIKSSHIFLFCHKTPESPRCLIESLMCGTPIVGFGSAYSEDLLKNHPGGLLSPLGDIDSLVQDIRDLHLNRAGLADLFNTAAKAGAEFSDEAVFAHRSDLIKEFT